MIWDLSKGEAIKRLTLAGHEVSVKSVAAFPDCQHVITGSGDKTAKIWSVMTGQEVKTLAGHEDEVLSVAVFADGEHVITGSLDRTAKIWAVSTGQAVKVL